MVADEYSMLQNKADSFFPLSPLGLLGKRRRQNIALCSSRVAFFLGQPPQSKAGSGLFLAVIPLLYPRRLGISSITKSSAAPGGMTPPAPRSP